MAKRSGIITIVAYVSLGLVLLGAIPGIWYTAWIFRASSAEQGSWAGFGPAVFAMLGGILANIGALLALIGAIIGEFTARPRYLWIFMIAIGVACMLSFSGVYHDIYKEITDKRHRLNIGEFLWWLMFFLPLAACVITGVIIGLRRRLKRKSERS